MGLKSVNPRTALLRFKSLLHHVIAVPPWASYLSGPQFNHLSNGLTIVISASQCYFVDEIIQIKDLEQCPAFTNSFT